MNITRSKHPEWSLKEFEDYHKSLIASVEKYPSIPHLQQVSIVQFICYGRPTGSFLQAVLSNNLMQAFFRADDENQIAMGDYVRFLHNHAPIGSYGSEELVDKWRAQKGMFHYVRQEPAQVVEDPQHPEDANR